MARAELQTLPADLADSVARHLVAAGLEEDPEQAYLHAQEAHRLAARVGVVREACGIAAYHAGHWAEALAELRAARRLTGRETSLPLMADSERALGRLDKALAIVHGPQVGSLDRATQIELKIVESGIRRDQGMPEAARLVLQVPELTDRRHYPWLARLLYAYADALLAEGRVDEAREWFGRAANADPEGETEAAERFDELDDVTIEDLAEIDDDELFAADDEVLAGTSVSERPTAGDEGPAETDDGELFAPGDEVLAETGGESLPSASDEVITEAGADQLPSASDDDRTEASAGNLFPADEDAADGVVPTADDRELAGVDDEALTAADDEETKDDAP